MLCPWCVMSMRCYIDGVLYPLYVKSMRVISMMGLFP